MSSSVRSNTSVSSYLLSHLNRLGHWRYFPVCHVIRQFETHLRVFFPRSRIGRFDLSWSLSFLDKDFGKGTAVSRLKPVWGGKATPSLRLKQRPIYSLLLCIQRQPYLSRCNHLPDSCSCADLKLIANIFCGGIEIPPEVAPTAGIKRGLMSSDFMQN